MTALTSLDWNIYIWPFDSCVKHEIVEELWPGDVDSKNKSPISGTDDTYLEYYSEQCKLALHDRGKHISVRKHQDIIDIVRLLRDSHTRESIKREIRSLSIVQDTVDENEVLDGSIDLVARLLVMIEIGSLQYGVSCQKRLIWKAGSLQDFIAAQFEPSRLLGKETVKLEKTFNACNLERIAGMQIVWTSNLVEHLRIIGDDNRVAIFHHATFLKHQRNRYDQKIPSRWLPEDEANNPSKNFPPGLVDETLQTLELLLPQWDKKTKPWYRKLQVSFNLDPGAIKCGQLSVEERQIENFNFWHDRLVILKQIFDEATPRTLSQWWHDRRNPVQYYTFWVAVFVLFLTAFFGLIQSIEGALQVYKTFNPS